LNTIDTNAPYKIFTVPQPWKHIDVQITRSIIETYLLENGIMQGDRLSMVSSVELRLPLVDYRLVEIVIGLRKNYSDYLLPPKTWLKMAVKDIVPRSVLNRQKRGFTPPVHEWYHALFDAYGPLLEDGILVQEGIITKRYGREVTKNPFQRVLLRLRLCLLKHWFLKCGEER